MHFRSGFIPTAETDTEYSAYPSHDHGRARSLHAIIRKVLIEVLNIPPTPNSSRRVNEEPWSCIQKPWPCIPSGRSEGRDGLRAREANTGDGDRDLRGLDLLPPPSFQRREEPIYVSASYSSLMFPSAAKRSLAGDTFSSRLPSLSLFL